MNSNPHSELHTPQSERLARQKRIVVIASCLLIVGGFVVLLAVKRLPLPIRFMVAMTDIVGGIVLIILANRKE